jgi:hypothetical protein
LLGDGRGLRAALVLFWLTRCLSPADRVRIVSHVLVLRVGLVVPLGEVFNEYVARDRAVLL